MMKLKHENYEILKKQTLSEVVFFMNDDPVSSATQFENAIKTLILLYVASRKNPKKHNMESTVFQTLRKSSDWFLKISSIEYPNEKTYSSKKIDITKFID